MPSPVARSLLNRCGVIVDRAVGSAIGNILSTLLSAIGAWLFTVQGKFTLACACSALVLVLVLGGTYQLARRRELRRFELRTEQYRMFLKANRDLTLRLMLGQEISQPFMIYPPLWWRTSPVM